MDSRNTIVEFILSWIARRLSLSPYEISCSHKFKHYKISLSEFCEILNEKYNLQLDPTDIYAYPTPKKLAMHIAALLSASANPKFYTAAERVTSSVKEDIAIIGMGCRLPGHVNSPADYWELLLSGTDAITEVPVSRWDIKAYYSSSPDAVGKMQTRYGGFIDNAEFFDAGFFNINLKEAAEMDPQQRLLLQVCWEALENANIAPDSLSNTNTAVIVGMSINDYEELKSRSLDVLVRNPYHNIGRYLSATAGRVSYFLDLHGPSYVVDAACASSLVAVHQAVQMLKNHAVDCVIVGGVNLLLDPEHTIGYDKARMLAPDGRCKTFDKDANGYVRSEGCGVLVLKRKSDALAANNSILALIKGSASNQDGSTNGITAPNEHAQAQVMQAALHDANLSPTDIDFIELHGTGTRLGDPIEFKAIKSVYATRREKRQIYLGAVKSNIGHLEAMAGIAGLIKTVLTLQHKTIPKNLHLKELNPLIDLNAINACVPVEPIVLDGVKTMRAGLSSFSFIGTNAHLILEEAPRLSETPMTTVMPEVPQDYLLVLSAKTKDALNILKNKYIDYLAAQNDRDFARIAAASILGRMHFTHRIAVIAKHRIEAIEKLNSRDYVEVHLNESAILEESMDDVSAKTIAQLAEAYCSGKNIAHCQLVNYLIGKDFKVKTGLPNYPFAHDTHKLTFKKREHAYHGNSVNHPLLGEQEYLPDGSIAYRAWLNLGDLNYLASHVIAEKIIFPASGWVEIALAICNQDYMLRKSQYIKKLSVDRSLILSLQHDTEIYVDVIEESEQEFSIFGYTRPFVSEYLDSGLNWQKVFQASLGATDELDSDVTLNISELQQKLVERSVEAFYAKLCSYGLSYGVDFQTVKTMHHDENVVLVSLENADANQSYYLHPALYDGVFQSMIDCFVKEEGSIYVAIATNGVHYYRTIGNKCYAYIERVKTVPSEENSDLLIAKVALYNEQGHILLSIDEAIVRRTERAVLSRILKISEEEYLHHDEWCYQVAWQQKELLQLDAPLADEHWLILTENLKLAADLIKALDPDEIKCSVLASPSNTEKEAQLKTFMASELQSLTRVVYLLDKVAWHAELQGDELLYAQQQTFTGLLFLLQNRMLIGKQTHIITWSAQAVPDFEVNPLYSGVIGFCRSVLLEDPELALQLIDLDLQDASWVKTLLLHMNSQATNEMEFAYRLDSEVLKCFVPRIKPYHNHNLLPPQTKYYRLVKDNSGLIDHLTLQEDEMPELAPNEIEVEVKAIGLNFRDVLNVMNLYPGEAGNLGLDAAGIVLRTGVKVTKHVAGDAVFGLMLGSAASNVHVHEDLVTTLPKNMNFTTAASLPTVFMTAFYALVKLAKLKKGEKVLIHAATGGVGQAAVQVAKHIGAEIYATAGNKDKIEFLRLQGIDHIYSSRTTEFAKQIVADTYGFGVDVILNSLSSEGFIAASVQTLSPNGRFCEIGKRGIWTLEEMAKARPHVAYHVIALDAMAQSEPGTICKLLTQVSAHFEKENYKPSPVTVFPMAQAKDAFFYLQQARHIGKVVLENSWKLVHEDACYLITGGLGELGLELAEFLISNGASHILLLSRRTITSELESRLSLLREQATIETIKADVSDKSSMFAIIEQYSDRLKGIFHTAGILSDATVEQQDWDHFVRVFTPKLLGTWYLYQACEFYQVPLDYFVTYSSIASTLGSAGQSNYAAANSFLNGFSMYARAHHMPAMAIQWGNWAEIGMAKTMIGQHKARGWMALQPKDALATMRHLLKNPIDPMIANINWQSLLQQKKPNPMFGFFASQVKHDDVIAQLLRLSKEEAYAQLQKIIVQNVLAILGMLDSSDIDIEQGFFHLGFDSLLIVDLRNRLQSLLGHHASLYPTVLFDYGTIHKLTDYIAGLLKLDPIKVRAGFQDRRRQEDIAIIGMSCIFPGASNLDEFWHLLQQGRDGISDVPKSRWDINAYYDVDPDAPGKMVCKKSGFINDIDKFDAAFFGISPREAEFLDPQQRLLLEHTYLALENANIAPESLKGSLTGVFVGLSMHDYDDLIVASRNTSQINAYIGTGNAFSTAAGRIAYTFGFEGPCISLDTACSSSLVALNEAIMRLRYGECSLAIVGGANAILNPDISINFSKAGMLAPDGHCKTFDASANGYVRGEGCGIVILKRLSLAKKDNDRIFAVIKASAINQDGASGGLTVPNGEAQSRLLTRVLAEAKLQANDVDYIECHGTGTSLGDPIEVHAIKEVYGNKTKRDMPLYLGSVKTNIGHLEAAAGVAGLIKVILALQHHEIPKNLHFQKLNPNIDLNFNGKIVTQNIAWKKNTGLRHVALSSFGFSGTNAHVILEEAPPALSVTVEDDEWVLQLSAKTKSALLRLVQDYAVYIESHPELSIRDVVYTANTGRSCFEFQARFAARTREILLENLHNNLTTMAEIKTPNIGNKVSLPAYPFDRKHYWLKLTEKDRQVDWQDYSSWCYSEEWEPIALKGTPGDFSEEKWLIIACDHELLLKWQDVLSEMPQEIMLQVEIILYSKKVLMSYLSQHYFTKVLLLCRQSKKEDLLYSSEYWLKLLLNLSQVLLQQARLPELWVFTEETSFINQEDNQFSPDKLQASLVLAPIIGFIKSMQIELPQLQASMIDVKDLSSNETISAMLHDILRIDLQDRRLVYRQQIYYAPRIVKKPISDSSYFTANNYGTYLITGGLGGLGMVLASWLIEKGACHLVLTSRRAPSTAVQQQIDLWQQAGKDILVHLIDMSREEDVAELIHSISKSAHPLRGVFHLAGISHQNLIQDIAAKEIHSVLAGKVLGAYYLHQLTKDLQLDCFVLYSSISAFLGSKKQAIYAAANQFLDSLAHYRRTMGLVALSIDWGPWAGTGMLTVEENAAFAKTLNLKSQDFIQDVEAMSLLSRLLAQTAVSKIAFVSPNYLRFMLEFMPESLAPWVAQIQAQLELPKIENTVNTSALLSQLVSLDAEQKREKLRTIVAAAVSLVLGIEGEPSFNFSTGFFELGMDSLMTVALQKELQQQFESVIELKANIGFDYPNVLSLADYLYQQLFEQDNAAIQSLVKTNYHNEPIAVIGMSCRFPGKANSPEALWDLLINGRDAIVDVPQSRWDMAFYYDADEDVPGKSYAKKAGFIDDIEYFDSALFNISPREAEAMDPQQRLLLEVSYAALERAGYSLSQIKGSKGGVFVGIANSEYGSALTYLGKLDSLSAYNATGGALNVIAGRLSYTYGLEGPCEAIDTACSSSLVALHNAIQSLRNDECSFAIAGGVNAMIRPETFIMLSKAKMLARDSHCKTFDASADGYARGEGCGVLILKRLSDATRDGDTIVAVIKGSAINQDGASSGLTVPKGPAQQAVIQQALQNAGIEPKEVSYVEAHGTGTSLGDPIEVAALAATYGVAHQEKPFLLGTIKTNIGHLESAAGVAGVMKVILSLQNESIPPHLNFNAINPHIDMALAHAELPFNVMPWQNNGTPRRAGVSSFGFSGINAHIILEEAPRQEAVQAEDGHWVLGLSAKTEAALNKLIKDYIVHLELHPEQEIADVVYTANTGRELLEYQARFEASTRELLLINLKEGKTTEAELVTPIRANKVILPVYPFERQRYWIDVNRATAVWDIMSKDTHPLLIKRTDLPDEGMYLFETEVSTNFPEFVMHHLIYGKPVIAGATYLSAMISVLDALCSTRRGTLKNVEFIEPVVLEESNAQEKRCIRILARDNDSQGSFKVKSFVNPKDEHVLHVEGQYVAENPCLPVMDETVASILARCNRICNKEEHLQRAGAVSLQLGHHFNWIDEVHYNDLELVAKMRLPDKDESKNYIVYPGFIDACFQTLFVWFDISTDLLSIPISLKSLAYDMTGNRPEYVYSRLPVSRSSFSGELPAVDLYLLDKNGKTVIYIEKFQMRAVSQMALLNILSKQKYAKQHEMIYVEHWEKRFIAYEPLPLSKACEQSVLLIAENEKDYLQNELATNLRELSVKVETVERDIDCISLLTAPYSDVFLLLTSYANNQQDQDIPNVYRQFLHFVFDVIQALLHRSSTMTPRLWIVTTGLRPVLVSEEVQLSLSGITGLYKTLVQEHPEFRAQLVDFESTVIPEEIKRQGRQLFVRWMHLHGSSGERDNFVAYREDDCYVPRLLHWKKFQRVEKYCQIPETKMYHLCFDKGSIASMHFEPFNESLTLDAHEAEVRIEASSLNFRDVLNVQGLYPGDAGKAGGDCGGIVTRVGDRVTHLKVGDRVFGMSCGTFASHAVGPADWLVVCPQNLSFAEAATLPAAFITSYVSLVQLAKLKPGEYVLIHGASGGVGLAGIQIAKQLGARIIATAGSAKKRAYLQQLGIEFIFDSRSFDYVNDIQRVTHGEGVDVVLNFLVGDFIAQTLKVTKTNGRFVEIGKRDIYSNEKMQTLRPDIDYHIYALDDVMQSQPEKIRESLENLLLGLKNETYAPLTATQFPLTKIITAFNYMSSAKHIGKIVMTPPKAIWPVIKPYAAILITGGLGGLAYAYAHWCIEHGAKNLLLTGRRVVDADMQSKLDALKALHPDVLVRYVAMDVGSASDVEKLLGEFKGQPDSLQVVLHTAGIIKDSILEQLDWQSVDDVSLPKVDGTWNLYKSLRAANLCHVPIILFSSIASVLGSGGQAHYAAANSFLNAISCWQIHHQHQAIQSFAFGPWAEVGMAKDLVSRHGRSGLTAIQPKTGFQIMHHLLSFAAPPSFVTVVDMKWDKFPQADHLALLDNLVAKHAVEEMNWIEVLEGVDTVQRLEVLQEKIRDLVADVMGMSFTNIPADKGFFDLGMDSLMAVELKNRLQKQVGTHCVLHSTIIFDYPNIDELTEQLTILLGLNALGRQEQQDDDQMQQNKGFDDSDIDDLINKALE